MSQFKLKNPHFKISIKCKFINIMGNIVSNKTLFKYYNYTNFMYCNSNDSLSNIG